MTVMLRTAVIAPSFVWTGVKPFGLAPSDRGVTTSGVPERSNPTANVPESLQ